jgi:antitoxin component of MazEF toxin-antitoxin module
MDMEIRLKLCKVGNSLMIAIPSQIVKDLKLKAGDDMLFQSRRKGGKIGEASSERKIDIGCMLG